ncbi:MAG: AAA family ATPase [Pseudobdellovibrio sp.]
MNFKATDCFSIFGTRGTGKSYLARKLNDLYPRSVVIDPARDWTDGEIVTSFTAFADKLKNKLNDKKFRIIFQFNPDEANKEELLNHVLRLCFHFKNLQVVIDEVQLFTSPHYLPEYFKNLLFMGRHQGISVMCITQRPAQLNKSILSQSLHVYCGQLHDKNDISAVSSFLNTDSNKLFNLKKRQFIYFNPEIGTKLISTEK